MVNQKRMLAQLGIHGTPPDILCRAGLIDNTLVLGRSAGLLARRSDKCTLGRDDGTGLVAEGVLVEFCDGRVTVHLDVVVIDSGVVVEQFWVWVVDPMVCSWMGLLVVVVVVVRHGLIFLVLGFWFCVSRIGRDRYVQWKERGEREVIDEKDKKEERKEKGSDLSSRLFKFM